MAKPILVIGLGGFGKWVVTAFKTRILDTHRQRPQNIDWVAFDLLGDEVPTAQFTRFELGRVKLERLDFSETSQEFLLFGSDYSSFIEQAEHGTLNDARFNERLTRDDAKLLVLTDETEVAGAERRHVSMLQFQSQLGAIDTMLNRKLKDNSIVFVVNSIAGGTGTGSFIDLLLLLRLRLRQINGKLVSILLLPNGFTQVKKSEDMNPLYANCYAAFREFIRLQYPKGNTQLCFSASDPGLRSIQKDSRHLVDVSYVIDGSGFDDTVEYYRGVAPATASFIEQSFMASAHSEQTAQKKGGGRTATSFDQAQTHALSNLLNPVDPYNAFALSTFGTHRLIFDRDAVKIGIAHEIALRVFKQLRAESWLGNPQTKVKNFVQAEGECPRFVRTLVHDHVTKIREAKFAMFKGLKERIEDGKAFPDLGISGIKPQGSLADTKKLIDSREEFRLGHEDDKFAGQAKPTFHAVCDYYLDTYKKQFIEQVNAKVLGILEHKKDTAEYGKGSLKASEQFIAELKDWYVDFLQGNQESNTKAYFTETCQLADIDEKEGTAEAAKARADKYYESNSRKSGVKSKIEQAVGSDSRKKYIELRAHSANMKAREAMRKLVRDIAKANLTYLESMHTEIKTWQKTFKNASEEVERAAGNLREVRRARQEIAADSYITEDNDSIESKITDVVINDEEYRRIKDGQVLRSELERRLREVIADIPHPGFSDIVNGFKWRIERIPDDDGSQELPGYRRGGLVCILPTGMPSFPVPESWGEDKLITAWNYEIVNYFLITHQLDKLNTLSAFKVLMLAEADPSKVLQDLRTKSRLMIDINKVALDLLNKPESRSFAPEDHYFIFADASHGKDDKELAKWIATFKQSVSNLPREHYTTVWEDTPPHIIAFSSARYSLPAGALSNLAQTEKVYRERIENLTPPPLHTLPGEKRAVCYENLIAKRLRHKQPNKLHPQVISLLEKENVVDYFVLGLALEIIRRDIFSGDKGKSIPCVYVGESRFDPVPDPKTQRYLPLDFCDVIYQLIFPEPTQANNNENTVDDLITKVTDTLGQMSPADIKHLRKSYQNKLLEEIKKDKLTSVEKDLFRVWVEMLEE